MCVCEGVRVCSPSEAAVEELPDGGRQVVGRCRNRLANPDLKHGCLWREVSPGG